MEEAEPMSTYVAILPTVFPYNLTHSVHFVAKCVETLLVIDEFFTNGSSFAVTADPWQPGTQRLWLSEASRDRLIKAGFISTKLDIL